MRVFTVTWVDMRVFTVGGYECSLWVDMRVFTVTWVDVRVFTVSGYESVHCGWI